MNSCFLEQAWGHGALGWKEKGYRGDRKHFIQGLFHRMVSGKEGLQSGRMYSLQGLGKSNSAWPKPRGKCSTAHTA